MSARIQPYQFHGRILETSGNFIGARNYKWILNFYFFKHLFGHLFNLRITSPFIYPRSLFPTLPYGGATLSNQPLTNQPIISGFPTCESRIKKKKKKRRVGAEQKRGIMSIEVIAMIRARPKESAERESAFDNDLISA